MQFDRQLSLQIDLCHWQLDALRYRQGWRSGLARWYWRWRLHRLEARICQSA